MSNDRFLFIYLSAIKDVHTVDVQGAAVTPLNILTKISSVIYMYVCEREQFKRSLSLSCIAVSAMTRELISNLIRKHIAICSRIVL